MNLKKLKQTINAVKAVIKNENGEILFLQRNPERTGIDNWDFPGGLIENGEDEVEALKRECQEELNVKIKILKSVGKWKFFRDFDQQWVNVQNYEVEIADGEIELSDEHIDFQWVKIEDIKKYSVKDESFFRALENKNIFDIWNKIKQKVNKRKHILPNKREIWWIKMGQNIGFEQNGKGDEFLRPVLVLRVFNRKMFFGIPMTSSKKNEKSPYYFSTMFRGEKYFFLLVQARMFSTRRLQQVIRKIDNTEFQKIKKSLRKILRI